MPVRTDAGRVQATLGPEYDASRAPDLDGFIAMASALTDAIPAYASGMFTVPPALQALAVQPANLELVERNLAAHFYQMQDPGYQSRSTAGASGAFMDGTGPKLRSSRFGNAALDLDLSRVLNAINEGKFAGVLWAGKPKSARLSWEERNGSAGTADGG